MRAASRKVTERADASKLRVRKREIRDRGQGDRLLDANAIGVSEKWEKARLRLELIVRSEERTADLAKRLKYAEMPKLAKRVGSLWADYLMPHRNSRHNPFAGLNGTDRARKMMAEVYQICDESTGALGPWWVR